MHHSVQLYTHLVCNLEVNFINPLISKVFLIYFCYLEVIFML